MECKKTKHVWAKIEDYTTMCKICGKTEVIPEEHREMLEKDQYGNCIEPGCSCNKENKKDADLFDNSKSHPKIKKLDKIQLQNINKTINDYVGYEVALKRKYYVT